MGPLSGNDLPDAASLGILGLSDCQTIQSLQRRSAVRRRDVPRAARRRLPKRGVSVSIAEPMVQPKVESLAWGRRYVMVRPDHFRVDYRINPYMDLDDQPDPALAMAQWV